MKSKKRAPSKQVATKKYVRSVVNREIETKHDNTEINATATLSTPLWYDLTSFSQGVTGLTRVGDRIRPIKLRINHTAVASTSTNRMRVVIFQWHPNTANHTPSLSTFIDANAGYEIQGPLHPDYRQQFTLLKDVYWTFDNVTGPGIRSMILNIRPKKTIEFNPAANTGTNHVYMLVMGDNNTYPQSFTTSVQFMFKDA